MRILLTGVSGQVGAALSAPLARAGSLVAADRARLDLAQPERVATVLDDIAPDLIVNPAAYTAVDRAEDERELAFRVNAEAPGAMARWAASRGVPLIHFSTDYVFDGGDAIRSAGGPHLVIRTSWVYAATGTNFLRTMARLARERDDLGIVSDQIGAPTSAKLIADAVARIVEEPGATLIERLRTSRGLVNVAAAGETSWHGFAVAIIEGLEARHVALRVQTVRPIRTQDYPTKARRPANSRFDLARLREVFGIATPDWRAALAGELDVLAAALTAPHPP
jgi:dTDP-4-dehydrorhamnose reductase